MKILILGGTRFLGRHLAQQALEAGHELTLLHRGRSNAGLFPQAEHLIADRDGDLALALAGGDTWDAAIDTSAYFPRQVRSVAQALGKRVAQYQLVSTISVYAGFDIDGMDEGAPVQSLADAEAQTTVTGANYGGLKALCEEAAYEGFGERCLVARPGLIVGPHDPTGRFTWWAQRFARAAQGGDAEPVIAPGDPDGPVQFIDARDAAAWLLHQAEACSSGTYNLTGPETPLSMADLMAAGQRVLAPQASLQWLPEAFLLAQGVAPWSDLPVWLPAAQAGLHRVSIDRALATGLQCRSLEDTLRDTAAWAAESGASGPQPAPAGAMARPAVGLSPEREAALLKAWRTR